MKKTSFYFAVAGSLINILFLGIVNFLTSPQVMWFIYPSCLLLLWPMGVFFIQRGKYKAFSIMVSLLLISYLITENYRSTPEYPWILYAAYPIICWPILIYLGKSARSLFVAITGSFITIVYYSILNIVLSSGYPWVIYPAFAILWWPLAVYYIKKSRPFNFSISASLFISIFFIIVNIVSTPNTIWAVYPIFAIAWWPLSMYFYIHKRNTI